MNSTTAASPITQQLQQQQMMDEFRAGVTACLRSWSALRTAVESGWGGADSLNKAEDLRRLIFQHFDGQSFPPARMTLDDLEDNLAIYLEEEFSVVLEDSSERQVADCIWRMYENCHKGDPSLARQLVTLAENAIATSAAYPVQIQSAEEDDDDDEDMQEEGEDVDESPPILVEYQQAPTPTATTAGEYANQFLFGRPRGLSKPVETGPVRQLGEAPIEEPPVEVDEDGFMAIQPSNNRRRSRKPV